MLSTGKLIVTQQDKRIDPSFDGNPHNFSLPIGGAAPWTAPSAGFSDFAPSVTRVPVASPDGSLEGRTSLPIDPGFGSGSLAGDTGNPRSPVRRALQNYKRSAAPDGSASTLGIAPPNANQPPSQPAPLPGIVSGQPMASRLPPSVFGLPDHSGGVRQRRLVRYPGGLRLPESGSDAAGTAGAGCR